MPEQNMKFYNNASQRHTRKRDQFFNHICALIPNGKKILELGCGSGYVAKRIQDKVSHYWGFDFAPNHIKNCKACISSNKLEFITDTIYKLNWKKLDYDFVLMVEVAEHLYKDRFSLKHIRPGTAVIITVPYNEPMVDDKPRSYPTHQRTYTIESFKARYDKLLTDMKFEIFKGTWIICKCRRD